MIKLATILSEIRVVGNMGFDFSDKIFYILASKKTIYFKDGESEKVIIQNQLYAAYNIGKYYVFAPSGDTEIVWLIPKDSAIVMDKENRGEVAEQELDYIMDFIKKGKFKIATTK